MAHDHIAAVDLGSNSFRLEIGRIVGDQIYLLDSLKESVRLAAGLTTQKTLDGASQLRALEALRRFSERLRRFDPAAVRAVATNTLRVAKNTPQFLVQAEAALGFPIEVVAGREEARLIYVGVSHAVPHPERQRLVVDIGGGSTEFIIGRQFEPQVLESLYIGCVGYSLAYFPDGRIDKRGFKEAELAARKEIQTIANLYREVGWEEAVGSSGTAKAIRDMLVEGGYSSEDITAEGIERLKERLYRAGDLAKATIPGLKPDRLLVLPGGLAILSAVFREFGLERMAFSEGALRLGVLYDLLGRYHHQDLRDATVQQFMRRYEVDVEQAERVAASAAALLRQMLPAAQAPDSMDARYLGWAARLHEIGLSVAHSSYHKHSAYILAHADMPGFSKMDQTRLARLVLAHRGKLERLQSALDPASQDWLMVFALRLASILNRARDDVPAPLPRVKATAKGFVVSAEAGWLTASPLTAAALDEEVRQWASVGREFRVRAAREPQRASA